MKRVPNAREVGQSLKVVRSAVKQALKELNESAGQLMARGDYSSAEALAAKGREIQGFQAQIEGLQQRWRELRGSGSASSGAKKTTTPLWAYYQPILKALAEAGGEARAVDLESPVERFLGEMLQPCDRVDMAHGRQRWQVMIRRSRKHLVAEGWIQDASGRLWRITEAGRRAAEKPIGAYKKHAK